MTIMLSILLDGVSPLFVAGFGIIVLLAIIGVVALIVLVIKKIRQK
jgi:ABC-type multidrug transport system permease subunit